MFESDKMIGKLLASVKNLEKAEEIISQELMMVRDVYARTKDTYPEEELDKIRDKLLGLTNASNLIGNLKTVIDNIDSITSGVIDMDSTAITHFIINCCNYEYDFRSSYERLIAGVEYTPVETVEDEE